MNNKMPVNWGVEPLSKFIEDAHHNCIATFVNYEGLPIIKTLKGIDALFRDIRNIPYNQKEEILLPSFVGRSHSAYLSSILLSASGAVPDAYSVIRLCMENAFYSLFIQDDPTINEEIPERLKIWLDRNESDETKKKCRNTFSNSAMIKHLFGRDSMLGEQVSALYERTITYGAHPNFYAHATASDLVPESGGNIKYLLPNTDACKLCISTAVETGLYSLKIYGLILRNRAGIQEKIQRIDWKITE
jgi:hypothetical protein